jgi:hypothetical protein
MAERTNIPGSPACGQWETLLPEALDGQLKAADQAFFTAHVAVCPACTALFEDARKGREWLEFLSPEPDVPMGLLDKILAQTGPGQVEGFGLVPGDAGVLPMPPVWQRPGFAGVMAYQARRFAEPRLLMTAAMAFFTIALTLNLTGVRLSSLRLSDLRPTSMRSFMERRLTMASTPIIRYYDHLRFVYEVESAMRQLRRTTEGQNGEGQGQGGENENRQKQKDTAPGESRQTPGGKDGGSRMDPPQQSGNPATNDSIDSTDFLETYLTFTPLTGQANTPAHSGGSVMEVWERSTRWIA